MYTKPRLGFFRTLSWTWSAMLPAGIWAAGAVGVHHGLGVEWVRLPSMPVGVLGTAVSFYLGFKGSAAYDRLWEARKIWGGIVNTSRTWGTFITTLVSDLHLDGDAGAPLPDVHRDLVYRHIAWLAALRIQLRRRKPWEHDAPWNDHWRGVYGTLDTSDSRLRTLLTPVLDAQELEAVMGCRNRATQLVQNQGTRLNELYAERRIEDFRHLEMVNVLEELYTLQGKCERIKNFPLPRQYATANHWFVLIFIALLPLALIDAFHAQGLPEAWVWGAVPVSMLVGWVFFAWDQVLEYTENPFEGLINDVPMDALSRTIEIDLREMLGERDLPEPMGMVGDDVLM